MFYCACKIKIAMFQICFIKVNNCVIYVAFLLQSSFIVQRLYIIIMYVTNVGHLSLFFVSVESCFHAFRWRVSGAVSEYRR